VSTGDPRAVSHSTATVATQRQSRWAIVVCIVVIFAYLSAVTQRSSLGVASVEATERFDVAAAALSALAVAQLITYAGLQIPVGALIDRYGPRILLVSGAVLMTAGQLVVAIAPDLGLAIVGRILVGAGDAMTFPAGIRMLAMWLDARRVPFMTQIYGQVGQFGQVLSAFPFMVLLHVAGWVPAFVSAAALSLLAGIIVFVVTASAGRAPTSMTFHRLGFKDTIKHVVEAMRRPGTQVGFWAHYVSQSSVTTFSLMWGFPFLTIGIGYSPELATLLLSLVTIAGLVVGPFLGILSARFPLRRSDLILSIVVAMAVCWIAVLAWPGVPPLWLVIVLICVISIGGPGSLIGFDFARTYNPARQLGSANGVVNVGGFLATFVMMFLIGLVLDLLRTPGGGVDDLYSLEAFRIAFLVQFPVVGFGVLMLLLTRRGMRRSLRDDEGIVVAPLWLSLVRRVRHGARRSDATQRKAVR